LMFGGKKIPELMRGIGRGMREFNDAKNNVKSEIEEGMKDKDKDEEDSRGWSAGPGKRRNRNCFRSSLLEYFFGSFFVSCSSGVSLVAWRKGEGTASGKLVLDEVW